MSDNLVRYEREVASARSALIKKISLVSREQDPRNLMMFWLNFSSLGIGMTQFVEDWIRRAGQKTKELGYEKLGVKLIKHAIHEKNHHLMMISDTHKLVEIWNKQYASLPLNAAQLINRKPLDSTVAYQKLHEDCIKGDSPFAQIAIEYEIENLSVVIGPGMLRNAIASLGEKIRPCLTFVFDHVEIDQAHTVYNRESIAEFVDEHPATVEKLIEIGSLALKIYGKFLNDCLEHTEVFEMAGSLA